MRQRLRSHLAAIVVVLSMLLLATSVSTAQDASPVATATPLEMATSWLLTQQADDGGFIGFSGESDTGFTTDALMAIVSANNAGIDTGDAVERAVAFLGDADHALVFTQAGPGQAAKLILGLSAAGVDPEGFANVMPLSIVEAGQNPDTGIYGTGLYDHTYAILALTVLGQEVPDSAIDALAATQAENGGWAYDASADSDSSDSNTTSMVVQALVASGQGDSDMVSSALTYLSTVVTADGAGYSHLEGTTADANSTALVAQAYLASGQDSAGLETALLSFQNESGGLFYSPDDTSDNSFATAQAIPPMAGQALPIVPASSGSTPAAEATPIAWYETAAA